MIFMPKPHTITPAVLLLMRTCLLLFFGSAFVLIVMPIEPGIGSVSSNTKRHQQRQRFRRLPHRLRLRSRPPCP